MLTNLKTHLHNAAFLFAFCATAHQAHAQEDVNDKWYQVEVAIFTQPENAQLAASQETFRKDITLSYGDHIQLLESIEEASLSRPQAEPDSEAADGNSIEPNDATKSEATTSEASTSKVELTPEVIADILENRAFVKLPVELRNLNETVGALERRNRQRILFHEAWRQPLIEPEKAAAIVIAGGESFDNEMELAGTITFGVSRYIHVHTNLWLSEFASNYGQGNQEWPTPPALPSTEGGDTAETFINLNAGLDRPKQDLWHQYDVIDTTYQNVLEKPYVITSLATLIQTRRMRSGEVHYIDHPKFGILITVTPFEQTLLNN